MGGLPELEIPALQVKIDTGAKSSSIHAFNIKYFQKNSQDFVKFDLHPLKHSKEVIKTYECPLIDMRVIKSSSGDREERPFIKTPIKIGGYEWEIELNLTNRDYMGFRMLLGREAMAKNVMVRPGVSYIHGKLSDFEAKKKYLSLKESS